MVASTLIDWYERHKRDLPWRRTRDPYAIWVSEIMLQQTRVEVVMPYYARFLSRFPDIHALAEAPEAELLGSWAGLGYYSRVRNMQRAARVVAEAGGFPSEYEGILALPGIGDYTAAAVSSIAFNLTYAVLDGNVMRVLARLTNEPGDIRSSVTRARLRQVAEDRLDRTDPGTYNQGMMELGAVVCTPLNPKCLLCPLEPDCLARRAGTERELPVKSRPGKRQAVRVEVLHVRRGDHILLWQREKQSRRLAGFWELPERRMIPAAELFDRVGEFRHSITNTAYTFIVRSAKVTRKPDGLEWVSMARLAELPLSTATRKALRMLRAHDKNILITDKKYAALD